MNCRASRIEKMTVKAVISLPCVVNDLRVIEAMCSVMSAQVLGSDRSGVTICVRAVLGWLCYRVPD